MFNHLCWLASGVLDCVLGSEVADVVQVEGGRKINVDLMPDVLHPNAQGMELMLTKCLDPAIAGKVVNLKPGHR